MSESHDRVLAALELREPDRVPTMDLMAELSTFAELLGKRMFPWGRFYETRPRLKVLSTLVPLLNRLNVIGSSIDQFVYDHAAASVALGVDSAWITYMPIWRFREPFLWEGCFGRTWKVELDGKGNLSTPMYTGGLIDSPDAWKRWDKSAMLALPERANRVYARIQREHGDRLFVFASLAFGIFENLWQPMGFERFVVALHKEKEFIRKVVRFYEDYICLAIEAFSDAGIPAYIYGDDLAYRSGPMLNPKALDELLGNSLRRITETAHALGMKIAIHSCGCTYQLLDWFADCGFDGVQSLEPGAGMELARVKEMVGKRLCLIGNVDVTRTLCDGTREEVFAEVKTAIAAAGGGGGYILSPTHSHQGVDVRHMRWMVEAVDEYGRYPLES
jgi:Uroporphyrinogen decarboxylase (URO-D)